MARLRNLGSPVGFLPAVPRSRIVTLAVVAAFAVLAGSAQAATVKVTRYGRLPLSPTGGARQVLLRITASPGEVDHMTVSIDPATLAWTVRDTGTAPTAGDYCTVAGDTATCAPPSGDATTAAAYEQIILGDADDTLEVNDPKSAITIDPGDGNDNVHIAAGTKYATIKMGAGADNIASDDPGTTLDYSAATAGINVTPDGIANDGTAGEHDNITGVFGGVDATPYDDHVVASAAALKVGAEGGDDTLVGSPGNDILDAGAGNNTVDAGAGDDYVVVQNEPGTDSVSGGAGRDTLDVQTTTLQPNPQWADVEPAGLELPGARTLTVRYPSDFESISASRGHVVGTAAGESLSSNGIVDGEGGDDHISGTGFLIGGTGRDTFDLSDTRANIFVRAADGAPDVIRCVMGSDLPLDMHVDKFDSSVGCDPPLKATIRPLRADRHGDVTVGLTCSAAKCKGHAYIRRPGSHSTTTYAQGSFTIDHGKTKRVRLHIGKRWRGKRKIDGQLALKATPLLWVQPLTAGRLTITSSSA